MCALLNRRASRLVVLVLIIICFLASIIGLVRQARAAGPPATHPPAPAVETTNRTAVKAGSEGRQRRRWQDELWQGTQSPQWSVGGFQLKAGAGLLFFSYGSYSTLRHFLREAEQAARSFREHNPGISIAIVSNNASVDRAIFDFHIAPREDLLFRGDTHNGGQNRTDKLPRQWLTRLLYLAHSPYEITWALDSNVVSCTPNAAQAFLDAALASSLWNYHLAHSSQRVCSPTMYPHNFNIVLRWSTLTASVLREWFLLQLRQGVASDDQKTLHLAELRHLPRLRVGHISPPFGAAFQPLPREPSPLNGLGMRITPLLVGRAHVLHSANRSLCDTFNSELRPRQMLEWRVGRSPAASNQSVFNQSVFNFAPVASLAECEATLGPLKRYCLVPSAPNATALQAARLLALASNATTAEASSARDALFVPPDAASGSPTASPPASPQSPPAGLAHEATADESHFFVGRASMESLEAYISSGRCGRLCEDLGTVHSREGDALHASHTPCSKLVGRRVQYLDRHAVSCARGHALSSFALEPQCSGEAKLRTGFRCVGLGHAEDHEVRHLQTACTPMRDFGLEALEGQRVACAPGWAVKAFRLRACGDEAPEAERSMRIEYECIALAPNEGSLARQGGSWDANGAGDPAAPSALGQTDHGVDASPRTDALIGRPAYAAGSLCGLIVSGEGCEALLRHPVSCTARTHALAAFHFTACRDGGGATGSMTGLEQDWAGGNAASGSAAAGVEGRSNESQVMQMRYICEPLRTIASKPRRVTRAGPPYKATQEEPL